MSKVFISGVAGFLGSHLADRMLENGHDVVGCDNLIGGYLDNVSAGVEFYQYDLNEMANLSSMLKGVDIVYHTACTPHEGLSVFSPSLIARNTLQISVNMMTAAIQAGVKRFVQCSSMARYGAHDVAPFREDMKCVPQDPYGIAKYGADLILQNLAEVHGIELVIAVPHNIVGPRQKYDDPFRNVASIMINLMLQNRQPIIYGDGNQVRCFSDVRDDIDLLYKLAFDDRAVGEIFNIGPDEGEMSINDLFELISNEIKFNKDPIYVPERPQEVRHATCSADKVREYFGYRTKYTTRESIITMIDYISNRGVKPFQYHLPIEIINHKTPTTWKERLF